MSYKIKNLFYLKQIFIEIIYLNIKYIYEIRLDQIKRDLIKIMV